MHDTIRLPLRTGYAKKLASGSNKLVFDTIREETFQLVKVLTKPGDAI